MNAMLPSQIVDEDDVASPCISVCKMDPALGDDPARAQGGLCVGCLRTIDEIIAWGRASNAVRLAILVEVDRRRAIPGAGP